MSAPVSQRVSCAVAGGVAQVRLTRPEKLNALTLDTLSQLAHTARALRADRTLRAVVIAGEGDSFCAGLDVATVLGHPAALARAFVPRPWRGTNLFQEACWAWRRLPVPVVAAVHGHCFGGGLQIALAADFRMATPDSRWSVLEGRWGLVPDMTGVATLRELVGIDVAKRLTMTAEVVTGSVAHRLGLVSEVCEDPAGAATSLAAELAARSPDAVAAAKELFNRSWTAPPRRVLARERAAQLRLLTSPNAGVARRAADAGVVPRFGPRARRRGPR